MKFIVALGLFVLVGVVCCADDKDCKKAAKHYADHAGRGNAAKSKVVSGTCRTGTEIIDGQERQTFEFDLTYDFVAGMMRTPMACRGAKVYMADKKLFGMMSSFPVLREGQCHKV